MKRIVFLLAFSASWPMFLWSYSDQGLNQMVGNYTTAASGFTSANLNTASADLAFGFMIPASKTVQSLTVNISGVSGSPTVGEFYCNIESDTALAPTSTGTAIGYSTTTTAIAVGTFTWTNFGGNATVGINNLVWFVIYSTDVAPASNFISISRGVTGQTLAPLSYSMVNKTSINGGLTWSAQAGAYDAKLCFTDGSCMGNIYTAYGSAGASAAVYASSEAGTQFTTPPGETWALRAVNVNLLKVGTPTSGLQAKIYFSSPPVLQATTPAVATTTCVGVASAFNYLTLYFPSILYIPPSTIVTATLVNSDTTQTNPANYYSIQTATTTTDASNIALWPFGRWGPFQGVQLQGSPALSWQYWPQQMRSFMFLLDSTGEFAPLPTATVSGE